MKRGKNTFPEWYWSHGLHDANIISAIEKQYGSGSDSNCLTLKIDCDGALYEANITEIRFYNYKILTGGSKVESLMGGWWLSDEVSSIEDEYILNLQFDTKNCETKILKIKFNKIEVVRS